MNLWVGTPKVGPDSPIAWRADIDGLRALSIALVLLFHAFPTYCRSGFIGVDIFFVISGYLITSDLLRRRDQATSVVRSIIGFYERRIRRIFPALIVVLAASAFYGWFFLLPTDFRSLAKYLAAGAGFATNFILWSEAGYFDQSAELKPLMHFWSLAIEEQFYIVWPLLILVLGRGNRMRLLSILMAGIVGASLAYCVFVTGQGATASYYSVLSRGWELGAGGLVALAHFNGFRARTTAFGGFIGLCAIAVIVWAAFVFIDSKEFPGWQATLPVGCAATLIWFARDTWADRYFLGLPPMQYGGRISYPLYLWHWVLLSFYKIYFAEPVPGVTRATLIIASVVLAVGTFHLVELPLRRVRLRAVVLGCLASLFAIIAFGVASYSLGWSGISLTQDQRAMIEPISTGDAYRYKRCLLDTGTQSELDFATECTAAKGAPEMLIWGDSHAAALYYGLSKRAHDLGVAISQRTASTCAPSVLSDQPDNGHCEEINASTRQYIFLSHPRFVVISARWAEYGDPAKRVTRIIEFLRDSGVSFPIIVGPAPNYHPSLQTLLVQKHLADSEIPSEMQAPSDTWPAIRDLDDKLRILAGELGVGYISILDRFCVEDRCRIRVSEKLPDGLLLSDNDHLSPQASAFLFSDLKARDLDFSNPQSLLIHR